MRKVQYLVRINKDPDSDWGASVPDLPGCVATGKTIDATLRRIQTAIELHLEGMREDDLPPPRPRSVPKKTARQVDGCEKLTPEAAPLLFIPESRFIEFARGF